MTKHAPEHFSVAFKFDVNKPSRKSDRITLRLILPGMFLGFILAALGAYEWIMRNYYNTSTSLIEKFPINKNTLNESFMNPTVFDAIIFLIGVGIVTSLFFSYVKYKKIIFDGKNFEVITRPVFGKKRSFKEPLKKYAGVLLRIEFFQYGFINRNKYIIELSHKNPEKSVPLYISMRAKNIRHIWKEYAKKLNMPAIVETEEGLKSTDVEDLDKPLIELVKEKKIKPKSNEKKPLPKAVAYTKKKDKTIIKAREIVWDAYNVIAWAVIAYIAFLAA
ncbi:MAG: hypothetical protein LBL47_04760, partial [Lactobacillus sp.]|nr:hypothetical protein [Lactobacillus sp.]